MASHRRGATIPLITLITVGASLVLVLFGACGGEPGKRAAFSSGGEGGSAAGAPTVIDGDGGSREPVAGGRSSAGEAPSLGAAPAGGDTGAGASAGGEGSSTTTEAGFGGQAGQGSLSCEDFDPPPSTVDVTVKPSAGCTQPAPQATGAFVKYTIATSGTKAADATGVPGPWAYNRDYYVWLPPGYDAAKPYPMVIQLPPCTVAGNNVYSLAPDNTGSAGVNGNVIRIGLSSPPAAFQSQPEPGCFDEYEGDDSIDFPFYEAMMDAVRGQLCFDQNRVFASGYAPGGGLASQLACKYAGDTRGYAIRAALVNEGGDRVSAPAITCTGKPAAGLFVHHVADPIVPFTIAKAAINRLLSVNGCAVPDYDAAPKHDYPIGGGQAPGVCQRIGCCPTATPVVVCALPGNQLASNDQIVNPGFATLITGQAAP